MNRCHWNETNILLFRSSHITELTTTYARHACCVLYCNRDDEYGFLARPGLVLEDERMEAIVASEAQGAFPAIQDARRKIVFFRPVDNNMAYQTFLGTGMKTNFDFVTQAFSIIESQANKVTHSVNQVRIGAPSGPPLAMKLSDVPYSILSEKLTIWDAGKTGYHVQAKGDMYHGKPASTFFGLFTEFTVTITIVWFVHNSAFG